MKKIQFYAGMASLGIAATLALIGLTKIETSFTDTFLANIQIYPAAFFALLGLMLMFLGLKPLWRGR